VKLQGNDGGAAGGCDFEIELSTGAIEDQADSYVALSEDAAGPATFADGSEQHFDSFEL